MISVAVVKGQVWPAPSVSRPAAWNQRDVPSLQIERSSLYLAELGGTGQPPQPMPGCVVTERN